MEEALSGMSPNEVEIETTFLDITPSNSAAKPIRTTAAASVHFETQYTLQLCLVALVFKLHDPCNCSEVFDSNAF